jgi:hypothetical protein
MARQIDEKRLKEYCSHLDYKYGRNDDREGLLVKFSDRIDCLHYKMVRDDYPQKDYDDCMETFDNIIDLLYVPPAMSGDCNNPGNLLWHIVKECYNRNNWRKSGFQYVIKALHECLKAIKEIDKYAE